MRYGIGLEDGSNFIVPLIRHMTIKVRVNFDVVQYILEKLLRNVMGNGYCSDLHVNCAGWKSETAF